MDQHDDRAMLDAEAAKAAVELVLEGDAGGRVRSASAVVRQQPQVAAMTSFAARFGVAGVHEEPMGPGLEPIGVPQLRQVPPGIDQCLLGRVLGECRVTQDPARHGVQGVADASDKRVECLFIAVHRPLDELALHASPGTGCWPRVRSVSEYE